MTEADHVIDVELDRVTARLDTMPVSRLTDEVIQLVHSAASGIVACTPDPDRPEDSAIPRVGPTALASQLVVVVRDYLNKRTAVSEDTAVAEILINLRRSLP